MFAEGVGIDGFAKEKAGGAHGEYGRQHGRHDYVEIASELQQDQNGCQRCVDDRSQYSAHPDKRVERGDHGGEDGKLL